MVEHLLSNREALSLSPSTARKSISSQFWQLKSEIMWQHGWVLLADGCFLSREPKGRGDTSTHWQALCCLLLFVVAVFLCWGWTPGLLPSGQVLYHQAMRQSWLGH
jgi:uncharacterized membrane protein YhdT